jgi:hypothetical protein
MGIYTNLATGSVSIAPAKPRSGLSRSSAEQLLSKASEHDPLIGSAYAAKDEVQTIPEQTDSGVADTYTLTISLPRLAIGTFTTGAIAYDAVASAIETAIDVAATSAGVTDWTNADISVAQAGAAGVSDGAVTLTFDGASVTEQPVEATVLTATGFTAVEPVVRTTGGQPDREATQALFELNVVSGTLQQSAEAPSDWVRPASVGQSRPRAGLIKDLAIQTIWEDGTDDTYNAIAALYELPKSSCHV